MEQNKHLNFVYPNQEFKIFKGYLIGNKDTILNKHFKEIINRNVIRIEQENHRRERLIALVWLGKPEKNQRLIYLDGNKNNLQVDNLAYKQKGRGIKKKEYRKKVRELTILQPLHLLKDFNKRGFKGYHLDHIISIEQGFQNNMNPEDVAHVTNLQMIDEKENINKLHSSYCVIKQCDHIKKLYKSLSV